MKKKSNKKKNPISIMNNPLMMLAASLFIASIYRPLALPENKRKNKTKKK